MITMPARQLSPTRIENNASDLMRIGLEIDFMFMGRQPEEPPNEFHLINDVDNGLTHEEILNDGLQRASWLIAARVARQWCRSIRDNAGLRAAYADRLVMVDCKEDRVIPENILSKKDVVIVRSHHGKFGISSRTGGRVLFFAVKVDSAAIEFCTISPVSYGMYKDNADIIQDVVYGFAKTYLPYIRFFSIGGFQINIDHKAFNFNSKPQFFRAFYRDYTAERPLRQYWSKQPIPYNFQGGFKKVTDEEFKEQYRWNEATNFHSFETDENQDCIFVWIMQRRMGPEFRLFELGRWRTSLYLRVKDLEEEFKRVLDHYPALDHYPKNFYLNLLENWVSLAKRLRPDAERYIRHPMYDKCGQSLYQEIFSKYGAGESGQFMPHYDLINIEHLCKEPKQSRVEFRDGSRSLNFEVDLGQVLELTGFINVFEGLSLE